MTIPKTMKAYQVVAHGKPLEVKEVPVPEVGPGQVLVKVEHNGVCHTDVHVRDGDWEVKCPLPMTPGHEVVGKVVAVGTSVESLKTGDRVGVPWLHKSCGNCWDCHRGWETVCPKQTQTGFTAHGGFAEYCLAEAPFVAKIPDSLTNVQAAPILCAGVTVYKALKESEVKPGQYIVVVGAGGGLGHVACQYAKAMGMIVIAVDVGDSKMKMLKDFCKADHTIDFTKTDLTAEVLRLTGGTGAHGCLMLATAAKPFGDAVQYTRPKGTVVCVALPPGTFPLSIFQLVLKAINVKGSIVGTRQDLSECLDFAARGLVKCQVREASIKEINPTLDSLKEGKIDGRVVVDMTKGGW